MDKFIDNNGIKIHFQEFSGDGPVLILLPGLTDNEEVDFVIVDLDETLDDDGILAYVANYREKLAWSRLPALIRLPEGREELQEKLVADGATSRFISKSVPASEVIALINAALAENLGFSWGKQSDSRA